MLKLAKEERRICKVPFTQSRDISWLRSRAWKFVKAEHNGNESAYIIIPKHLIKVFTLKGLTNSMVFGLHGL